MAKINILPKNVAELIAAGEVVERPASVVKELVENSLDAGASAVTVEIKNGGVRYIRVSDNGCGISRADLPKAFISHATSKISGAADLDAIMTLGFRGEALPSIAAVSRLSVLTRAAEEETGTLYTVEGGEVQQESDAGCPVGATFTVRDIFYNTPARMKFLKKDATEGIYVSEVVTRTAIARPDVKFTFIREGKQMFSTPGSGDLYETVYSVLGKEIASTLIKCEYEHDGLHISGFISKPLNNRPNRNYQYFYVNRRYVKIPVAAVALDEGYKNSIMVGKFPVCFLNIDIPAGKIDVNVHPAKTEIRFSDEKKIFEAVYYAARSALAKGDTARPEIGIRKKESRTSPVAFSSGPVQYRFDMSSPKTAEKAVSPAGMPFTVDTETDKTVFSGTAGDTEKKEPFKTDISAGACRAELNDTSSFFADKPGRTNSGASIDIVYDNDDKKSVPVPENTPPSENAGETVKKAFSGFSDLLSELPAAPVSVPAENTPAATPVRDFVPVSDGGIEIVADSEKHEKTRILGEVFNTYILVESGSKLIFIDKHAAHERMIFNSLSKEGSVRGSQLLMLPVTVNLPSRDYIAVLENTAVFSQAGYSVEDFGENCVIVREIPTELTDADIVSIITEMAGKLSSGNLKPVPEKLDWLYDSTACRAAVKAGSVMKAEEMEAFVKTLLSDNNIKYCPHGRPVMFELSKHEIEKQFGRLG